MACPIVIKSEGDIIWGQPKHQSQNTYHSIVLQLGKETVETLKQYGPISRQMNELESEAFQLVVNEHPVTVRIRLTALDRKAADAVTGLGGAYCDLCHISKEGSHCVQILEEEQQIQEHWRTQKL